MESFLEEQTVTIQQLEEKTGATKQTIHKQIRELEQIFSFRLKKYRNTFYLQNKEMINYTTISHYFYHHSIQLQLVSFIFFHPFASTAKIANTLEISETKFRNVYKQVTTALKLYDISLTKSPFCFVGDFNKMRQFFQVFFSEKYYTIEEYITSDEQEIIEKILQGFVHSTNESSCRTQQLNSLIWVTIKLSAHLQNTCFFLSETKVSQQIVIDYATFNDVFKIPYPGLVEWKISVLHTTLTEMNLSPELLTKRQAFVSLATGLYELFNIPQVKLDEKIYDIVTTILIQYTGVTYLLNHQKKQFVFAFFKQNGNFSIPISNLFLNKLTTFKNDLQDESLFYELIYVLLVHDYHLLKQIRKTQKKIKVGLFFTHEKAHQEFLLSVLKNKFSEIATFKLLDVHQPTSIAHKLNSFDYCLTNIPISKQTRCILLDNYPSFETLQELETLFQQSYFQAFLNHLEKPLALHIKKNQTKHT
ncbi:helix-turn-helix domain-containing protein [Enterococcus villorum]|uniref:Aspartate aminotransferase n=2 Tax=Enterococcus villorum TaxID=112904 RepID=A0A511J0S1_9ENTE|nr:helix-turn-helix domain-containing protein [Enterococcus villorum]EOH86185.1 hypothetical protein UAO_02570 [Enterococcus villorum ATCC 700913]EOW78741.1 hypothetical protein I591_00284 [Enterococcus villorum ATCC 700913]GEL91607.1 aspartate aminotransferase [Enterococcus villorum]